MLHLSFLGDCLSGYVYGFTFGTRGLYCLPDLLLHRFEVQIQLEQMVPLQNGPASWY